MHQFSTKRCNLYLRLPLLEDLKSRRDENISGHFERKGGYQAEEAETAETRRRTVKVGDREGNYARRERKKEGGEHFRKEQQIEGKPRRLRQA